MRYRQRKGMGNGAGACDRDGISTCKWGYLHVSIREDEAAYDYGGIIPSAGCKDGKGGGMGNTCSNGEGDLYGIGFGHGCFRGRSKENGESMEFWMYRVD